MEVKKLSVWEVRQAVKSRGLEAALKEISSLQIESVRLASHWEQLQVSVALVDGILQTGDAS